MNHGVTHRKWKMEEQKPQREDTLKKKTECGCELILIVITFHIFKLQTWYTVTNSVLCNYNNLDETSIVVLLSNSMLGEIWIGKQMREIKEGTKIIREKEREKDKNRQVDQHKAFEDPDISLSTCEQLIFYEGQNTE